MKDKTDEPLRAALEALQRLSDAFARRRLQLARGTQLTEASGGSSDRSRPRTSCRRCSLRRNEQTPAAISS
jgi:hypothetical protein